MNKKRFRRLSPAGVLAGVIWLVVVPAGPGVNAATIKNISSGYDDVGGVLLADAVADTDYVIGPGGLGGHIGEVPLVRTSPLPIPWLADADSPNSRWLILPGSGSEGISVEPENYFFDTTVDLTGFDPATAQLSGLQYAADNKLLQVAINGTAVFSQPPGFAEEFMSLTDLGDVGAGLFHSGTNTIRFELHNQTGFISPLGLRVEGVVTGQPLGAGPTTVPEPTTLLLWCCLGTALAVAGRRQLRMRGRTMRS